MSNFGSTNYPTTKRAVAASTSGFWVFSYSFVQTALHVAVVLFRPLVDVNRVV